MLNRFRAKNAPLCVYALAFASFGLQMSGCNTRTQLEVGDHTALGDRSLGRCEQASDCLSENLCELFACEDGLCASLGERNCPSSNECEMGVCEPETGACAVQWRTEDLDGDGHYSPLPGFFPGEEGSCGDDCDDTAALSYPGGQEACDGVDNDCDGVVDNAALYLDPNEFGPSQIVAEAGFESSSMRSVVFGEDAFFFGYWGKSGELHSYLEARSGEGEQVLQSTEVSLLNAPSFGATLAFNGVTVAAAWSDAREDDNYEVYFALFNQRGEKLGPDLRISEGADFSLHPDIVFSQGRFYLVYDDWRDSSFSDGAQLFARVVGSDGQPMTEELRLGTGALAFEHPKVAASVTRLAVVSSVLDGDDYFLGLQTFDKDFNPRSALVNLSGSGGYRAEVAALGEDFLVIYDSYLDGPGSAIYATLLSGDGEVLIPAQPVTFGASYARSHSLVSLGDRVLLSWADDYDGNYEIYAKVLDGSLNEIEPRTRLTQTSSDTLNPQLALGSWGRVGLGYDDWQTGTRQAYFMTFGCAGADVRTDLPR